MHVQFAFINLAMVLSFFIGLSANAEGPRPEPSAEEIERLDSLFDQEEVAKRSLDREEREREQLLLFRLKIAETYGHDIANNIETITFKRSDNISVTTMSGYLVYYLTGSDYDCRIRKAAFVRRGSKGSSVACVKK